MINGRIIFDVVILAITGWAFSAAQAFPESFMQEHITSSFFPSIVSGLLMVLMLNVLWTDFRELRTHGESVEKMDPRSAFGALAVLALLVIYIFLIEGIGFRLATMVFLFAAMMVSHITLTKADDDQLKNLLPSKRYTLSAALASVVVTLLTHAVFVHGFGLSLY